MKHPPQHLRDPFDPEFLVPPLDLDDLLPDRRTHPRRPRLLPGGRPLGWNPFFQVEPHGFPFLLIGHPPTARSRF